MYLSVRLWIKRFTLCILNLLFLAFTRCLDFCPFPSYMYIIVDTTKNVDTRDLLKILVNFGLLSFLHLHPKRIQAALLNKTNMSYYIRFVASHTMYCVSRSERKQLCAFKITSDFYLSNQRNLLACTYNCNPI